MVRAFLVCLCSVIVAACPGRVCAGNGTVRPKSADGWDIVIATDAPPAVVHAAGEFRKFFAEATGETLPVVREATRPGRHVHIGAGGPLEISDLAEEDLRISIREDGIAIAGGSPRGTLYGVYTFLERYIGVRFLAPDHTHVPDIREGEGIAPGDFTFRPPFEYRESFYGPNQFDRAFAVRMRQNAATDDPRLGGRIAWRRLTHTMHRWVPVRRYGREHPEYFAEIDGRRYAGEEAHGRDGTQPCLTHPEVKRLILEGALAQLVDDPGRGNVSIVQNDTPRYCQCESCRAIDERERSGMGALLTLVNETADEMARRHPGVRVGTLAYQYSRRPPRHLRPRGNVVVQVCSSDACVVHAVDDRSCPRNERFLQDLQGWAEAAPCLYVWHYCVNFQDYLAPFPNLRAIGPDVRRFASVGVKGVFMQGAGEARATEMADLRNYMICNLLWDPSRDPDGLMEEFLALHYGRAAPPIREYIRLIHENAGKRGIHPYCAGPPAAYGVDASTAAEARALFDRALRLAESDAIRRRVEKASIAAVRAEIEPAVRWCRERPGGGRPPREVAYLRPQVERFLELCRAHGVDFVSERERFHALEAQLRAAFGLQAD